MRTDGDTPTLDRLVARYGPQVSCAAAVLAVYYGALALLHPVMLAGQAAVVMTAMSVATAAVCAHLWLWNRSPARSFTRLEITMTVCGVLATANVLLHALATGDPDLFFYLPMAAFAFAMVGPSVRVAGATLSVVFVAGAVLLTLHWSALGAHGLFALLTSVVLGALAARWVHALEAERTGLIARMHLEESARAGAEAAMAARTVFVASLSHELRTPLHSIIGYGELLLEDASAAGDAQAAGDQRRVLSAARSLLRMVDDVLDFSRLEAGDVIPQVRDMRTDDVVADAVGAVRQTAEAEGWGADFVIAGAGGEGSGDPFLLQQCLANVLVEAARSGASPTVSLFHDIVEGPGGKTARFFISGARPQARTREPAGNPAAAFSTLDMSSLSQVRSLGLGVASAARLADVLGGRLGIDDENGRARTYRIDLPLAA